MSVRGHGSSGRILSTIISFAGKVSPSAAAREAVVDYSFDESSAPSIVGRIMNSKDGLELLMTCMSLLFPPRGAPGRKRF